ncbi:MAG TPA: hypothetical protein EYP08_00090, partial [Pyrodictiaceae archaeon]|nr:hypothetical protein [Pyrodictiaceae archaeon]
MSGSVFWECVRVVAENKVLLHFLRVLGIRDRIRFREEARYRRFVEGLSLVARALEGLEHVFIKLRKPVVYVPADIDVLVDRSCVGKAVSRLVERGFRVVVVEPYSITLACKGIVVDVYV